MCRAAIISTPLQAPTSSTCTNVTRTWRGVDPSGLQGSLPCGRYAADALAEASCINRSCASPLQSPPAMCMHAHRLLHTSWCLQRTKQACSAAMSNVRASWPAVDAQALRMHINALLCMLNQSSVTARCSWLALNSRWTRLPWLNFWPVLRCAGRCTHPAAQHVDLAIHANQRKHACAALRTETML